jgi:hypothetical protein
MHHWIMHVMYEFDHGPMIFDRVISLEKVLLSALYYLLLGSMYNHNVEIACVDTHRSAQV